MGFKRYFLSWLFWLIGSFLLLALGWISGLGLVFFGDSMGWIKSSDYLIFPPEFILFPFVGGIIGLIVLHILRILSWSRLHRKLTQKRSGWTKRDSLSIVLIDEILWLSSFLGICILLLNWF